jgi:Domain of unknown function (DUF2017)
MRVRAGKDQYIVTLNLLESRVLLRVFQALVEQYHLGPAEIDPKIASAWYSTRGCAAAKMTDEETRDWVIHLQSIKAARLGCLGEWAKQLSGTQLDDYPLHVRLAEVDSFLTAVNDYRLMLASRHNLGQAEMDLHAMEEWTTLSPARRTGLFEIHFLAVILEEMLRALSGQD